MDTIKLTPGMKLRCIHPEGSGLEMDEIVEFIRINNFKLNLGVDVKDKKGTMHAVYLNRFVLSNSPESNND